MTIALISIMYILIGLWIANFAANYITTKNELKGITTKQVIGRRLMSWEEAQRNGFSFIDDEADWYEWMKDHPASKSRFYLKTYEELPAKWNDPVYGHTYLVVSSVFFWPAYVLYLTILRWPFKAFKYCFVNSGKYLARELVNPKANVKEIKS